MDMISTEEDEKPILARKKKERREQSRVEMMEHVLGNSNQWS